MSPEQVVVDAQHDTAIALFVQQALEGQNESVKTGAHNLHHQV